MIRRNGVRTLPRFEQIIFYIDDYVERKEKCDLHCDEHYSCPKKGIVEEVISNGNINILKILLDNNNFCYWNSYQVDFVHFTLEDAESAKNKFFEI